MVTEIRCFGCGELLKREGDLRAVRTGQDFVLACERCLSTPRRNRRRERKNVVDGNVAVEPG